MKDIINRILIIRALHTHVENAIARTPRRVQSTRRDATPVPPPAVGDYIFPPNPTFIFALELLDVRG